MGTTPPLEGTRVAPGAGRGLKWREMAGGEGGWGLGGVRGSERILGTMMARRMCRMDDMARYGRLPASLHSITHVGHTLSDN